MEVDMVYIYRYLARYIGMRYVWYVHLLRVTVFSFFQENKSRSWDGEGWVQAMQSIRYQFNDMCLTLHWLYILFRICIGVGE